MTRYVIIGAGAVGVTVAVQLQEAGRGVVLVGRGAQLAALQAGQLRYVRPDGQQTVSLPSIGGPDELVLAVDDVLVLATKTQDAEQALATWAWQPVKHHDGTIRSAAASIPVITLQNGLDAERAALRRFSTVVGAVLWIPASFLADGEVLSPAAPAVGLVWLGEHPGGTHPVVAACATDLRAAGFDVQVVHDIPRWKAAKLLNSVTFVLDALYPDSELRERAKQLLQDEAREILTASGYEIADTEAESTLDPQRLVVQAIEGKPYGGNSTWQSLTRSGSLESDYLNGEIVLLARLVGRDAPLNGAILERIQRAARDGVVARSVGDDDLLTVFPSLRSPVNHLPVNHLLANRLPANDVLVDASTLNAQLQMDTPPVLLDVRWALGDPDGHQHYLDGHLPGAVFVDLDTELAATHRAATDGRHPLPDLDALQQAARRWGVRSDRAVVVYDNGNSMSAARAWWLLRWAGVVDVRILNGALSAWTALGLPLAEGDVAPDPGDITLTAGHLPVLDADTAAEYGASAVLLDARASERYRGEVEPIDPRAGHIPGARSAPTGDNVQADGSFLTSDALRRRFDALGATPGATVGVYCGSGVTAAHEIAALRIAGIEAALFAGSWSAWSSDPERPVATGPESV